jgi:competence protein ComEC
LQQAMETALDTVQDDRFACHSKDWCTAVLDNGAVLVTISDPTYLGAACDAADIVVIPIRLRLARCRSGATVYTGASLRRTGAVEIDLNAPPPGITTAFDSLDRPWSRHRAYDWRTASFTSSPKAPPSDSPSPPVSPISDSDE